MCINIRSVCVVFNVILCFLICVICLTIPVHGVAPRLPAPHKGTINPHVVRRRWESCCNRAKTDNLYTCRERSCYYAITTLVKWESSFMHCRHRFSGGPESFINNVKLENEEEELFLRNFIKGLNRYSKGDEKWCTSGIISLDPGSLNSSSPAYDLNSFRWTWDNDSLSDSWLKRKIKDISLPNDKKPEATYALSLVVATGSQKPAKSHQQFCWQKTTDLCVPLCEFRSYGPKNPDDDDVTSITDDTNTTSTTGQTNSYFETTTHEIDNAFNDCCSEARKREDSFCYRSRSCYRLFFNRQNWSEARKTCKEAWFPSVSPEVSARIDLLNFSLTDEISTNYIARKVGSIFIPGESTDSGYRKIWTDKWICNSIIKGKLQVGDDVTDQNLKDQNLLTGFPSNPQIANGNCFPIMLKIKAQGSTPLTWNGVLEDPSRHHYFLCEFSRNLDGKDGNTTQTPETSTETSTTGTTSSLPKSAKCKGKIVTIQMPSGKEILHWPDTRAGDKAFKPCPSGFSGMIEWKCDPDTLEFTPRERPMYQCKNKWIEEFENKMKEDKGSTDVVNIAASLVNKTNEISLSFGEDIKGIVNLVEEMKRNFIEQRKVETKDPNQVKTFAHSVCNTYSNIIRPNQKEAWKYLKEPEQVRESSKILRGVEEVALLASCFAKVKSGIETYITENIAFQTFHFEDTTLGQSIRFPYNESIYNSTSIISLPAELPLENWSKYCENDYTGVGIMYKNLGTYLSSPNEGPKRTQDSGSTFVINSPILAFNFENTTESRKLPANHNVIIVMEHVRKDVKSNQSNCVFWNFTKSMWDTSGCETIEFNKTHTTCQCDHLTNFAVLMDIQGVLPDDENDEDRGHFVRIANIMTYVCCSLSSLFLLMTLIILLSFRILHNRRTTIICNLSLCLLVVHLLVVFALDRTEIPILCSVFAGLLLYALLAAFFWMLLEAYHIYQMLVVVLNRAGNPTRWKIYFCGYGLPLFIVVTAAATERKGFGTPKYCWLSREHGLIWSFAGPVAAIILTNFIIMLMALRNASTAKIKKQQTRRTRALSWIKGTMSLMCLLGITWLVGFFFLNQETIILSFIFIILNGLQGVFIFIFHVALNEKARNQLLHFYKLKATPTISTQTTVRQFLQWLFVNWRAIMI